MFKAGAGLVNICVKADEQILTIETLIHYNIIHKERGLVIN